MEFPHTKRLPLNGLHLPVHTLLLILRFPHHFIYTSLLASVTEAPNHSVCYQIISSTFSENHNFATHLELAMAEGLTEFYVETLRASIVQSPLPSPDCWLKGSNIDLTVPNISPGHFFVYKSLPNKTYGEVLGTIKKALSETLILFYPLAGRFVERDNGEAEIYCDNQGVPFVEARAHADIKEVDFSQPSLSVGGKLSPTRHPLKGESRHSLPVLAVQVISF